MNSSKVMALAIVGIMAVLGFLPMVTSAQEAGAVANVGTATSIVVVPAYNNPVINAISSEPSMIYNTTTGWIDEWFTSGTTYGANGYNNLWYTHTTNANYTTHTTPVRVMQNIRFPYVVQYSGVFYCFAHNNSAPVGNLYLWTSHDKLNWTIANGGQAVLHHSVTTSSIRYWMANPAVILVNNMWYMWIECANSSASGTYWSYFATAYTYSAFSSSLNFTTNMTSTHVITGGVGNAYAEYVPDRAAVMLIAYQLTSATLAQEMVWTIPLAADKTLPASYTKWPGFVVGLPTQVSADWTWAVTPTGLVFQMFHNQPTTRDIYQGSIALTLDQFYDYLTGTTPLSTLSPQASQLLYLIPLFLTLGILMIPVNYVIKQIKTKRPIQVEEVIRMFIMIVVGLALVGITYAMI